MRPAKVKALFQQNSLPRLPHQAAVLRVAWAPGKYPAAPRNAVIRYVDRSDRTDKDLRERAGFSIQGGKRSILLWYVGEESIQKNYRRMIRMPTVKSGRTVSSAMNYNIMPHFAPNLVQLSLLPRSNWHVVQLMAD